MAKKTNKINNILKSAYIDYKVNGKKEVEETEEVTLHIIPPRPFIRPALAKNQGKWRDFVTSQIKKGESLDVIFEKLGLMVQGDIQTEISNVFTPPLAKSTIRNRMRKHKVKEVTPAMTKPLIDTGLMINSVQHKIYKGQ